MFDYNYNEITSKPEDLGFENVLDERIVNVALFGIDARDPKSFKGLSDSIMILSLNTNTKKVKIISVMRDSLVPIEKNGRTTYNKINSAYATGPELAIKTLNKTFGLDISEYATVNFNGMMDIIDAVGGIDVTLTEREVKARGVNNHGINDMIEEACLLLKKNPKDYYVTEWGDQHLNGIQAVAYSRIRYVKNIWGTNNDYGRTDRQRFVMQQLFNKAKTLSKDQYLDLVKALVPCTETSLSPTEILDIAYKIMLDSPTFEQARMPLNEKGKSFLMPAPKGSFGSVAYYDLGYASKIINAFIYDYITFDEFRAQNPIEKNDWYAARG
jgi:LCP family protein required for cell wall assembly